METLTEKRELFRKKEQLGEILVRRRLLSKDQLNQVLEIQKTEKSYLGEICVSQGFVKERDVIVALIVQCNVPYIAIDKYEIDQEILALVPQEIVRRYSVVPLGRVGNVLSVVMANPFDGDAKSELHRLTNCQIASFIATKSEITKAIEKCFN